MIADIKDYTPSEVEFVLTDAVKEKFPLTLFDGCNDIAEIIEQVNNHFTPLFPESELATRKLDSFEIQNIREEYCIKEENDLPKYRDQLAQAIEKSKQIKRDAEEALQSVITSIAELAAKVKDGTSDYQLSSTNTIRLALCGYYLFYSWVDGKFQLVKADKIPEWDERELWSQEDKNRQGMKDLFGYEFPETEKPSSEGEDDLPWNNEAE